MKSFKTSVYYFLFCSLCSIKIFTFFIIKNYTDFGRTKDSEYYHSIAIGSLDVDEAVNIWPVFLNNLNLLGLYDRFVVNVIILLISVLIIPVLMNRIISVSTRYYIRASKRLCLFMIVISLYPSVYFFSLDITRDIVMLLIFMVALFFLSVLYFNKSVLVRFIGGFFFISLSLHLFYWREYLSVALLASCLIVFFSNLFKVKLTNVFMLYILGVVLFHQLGYWDLIIAYRGENGMDHAQSSIGLGLMNRDGFEFLILYLYSFILQMFSLHWPNLGAVALFFLESLPIAFVLIFLYRNKSLLVRYEKHILIFSLLYATIWVIGNDNLGTAMRLRMFNYIPVLICFFTVIIRKQGSASRENS